jgi:hypothetical protein
MSNQKLSFRTIVCAEGILSPSATRPCAVSKRAVRLSFVENVGDLGIS